jgi:hypothetical protein
MLILEVPENLKSKIVNPCLPADRLVFKSIFVTMQTG